MRNLGKKLRLTDDEFPVYEVDNINKEPPCTQPREGDYKTLNYCVQITHKMISNLISKSLLELISTLNH